jgi:hypothetical protein
MLLKGEGEACGFDVPKGAIPESSPAVLPNEGIGGTAVLKGDGAAPTGADSEDSSVFLIESRGLETLYFLANLANISTSRPYETIEE